MTDILVTLAISMENDRSEEVVLIELSSKAMRDAMKMSKKEAVLYCIAKLMHDAIGLSQSYYDASLRDGDDNE